MSCRWREVRVLALAVLGAAVLVILITAMIVLSACAVSAAQPIPPAGPIVQEASGVNLAIVCLDAEHVGKPISGCAQSRQRFSSTTPTSLVRVCPTPSGQETCADYSLARWKKFADVNGSEAAAGNRELIEVCTTTKVEGAPVAGGDCKASSTGSTWSGMKYVWKEKASQVPALPPATFTITPTSGDSPLDVTLAWNVPGMTGDFPCLASGDWEGRKGSASTEVIASVMKSSSYTLTCTDVPAGGVVLTWTKPTTNADGTPLVNPAGFLLSYGDSVVEGAPALSRSITLPYSVSTYTFDDLLPMRWFFAIQTIAGGAAEVKSDLSNIVSFEVRPQEAHTVQRYTATVSVAVTVKPSPPGELKAAPPPASASNQSQEEKRRWLRKAMALRALTR